MYAKADVSNQSHHHQFLKNKVMKTNEAPEKVYCTPTEGGFYLTTIKPEPPFDEGVEYIRKDAFIEQVCEYMSYLLDTSNIDVNYKFEFIEEIRNYMKGE